MKTYDVTVNKAKEQKLQLANGHISTTTILFEEQNIVAKIEAKGDIAFLDTNENLLATISIPGENEGKKVYTQVVCSVDENGILLKFPIVEWIDNYPHCDGEHDRWDEKIIGYHDVGYHWKTNTAFLVE